MDLPRPNPPPANLPQEIGGFRIQRVLGAGGMATVYAALQTQPRRTVALKVMKAGIASDRARHRFKREVEILGKLQHPYIAQVYSAGMHDDGSGGVPYFAMEYVSEARTILEFVAAKQLELRERLKLFAKVCAAVEHGHRRKIVHRDLKPGNILIDSMGEPKVIDFGIAHAAEIDLAAQTMHTEAGVLVGTLQYMAPEQVDTRAHDIDSRCDVYSLGAVLYKMLTGRPAHDLEALPMFEAVRIIREETPRPPGEIRPELLGDLETIILKALDHDPERRYRNAGSLGRDLVRYLANKPIHARRASLRYRTMLFVRRNVMLLSAAAIVVIVVLIATGMVILDRLHVRRAAPVVISTPTSAPASTTVPSPPEMDAAELPKPYHLNQHTGRIRKLVFSGNGKLLVSASDDHTVIVWDLESHAPLQVIREFDRPVRFLDVDNHGSVLVAAPSEGPILVLNPLTGSVQHTLKTQVSITSLALSPLDDRLVFGGSNLALQSVMIGADRKEPVALVRGHKGEFSSAAVSLDGQWVAGGARGDIAFFDVVAGREGTPITTALGQIVSLHFVSGKDELLRWLAVDEDGKAAIGKFEYGLDNSGFTPFTASRESVIDVAINAECTRLATASAAGIALHNLLRNPPLPIGRMIEPEQIPLAIALDPASRWVAVGDSDGRITMMPIFAGQ